MIGNHSWIPIIISESLISAVPSICLQYFGISLAIMYTSERSKLNTIMPVFRMVVYFLAKPSGVAHRYRKYIKQGFIRYNDLDF